MYQMTAEYVGELRTTGKHLKSGNTIVTDPPVDNNGKGEAYSPTDLVAAALCSCMMTIMGIVAKRDNIPLTSLTATIEKVMTAEPPRKIAKIKIDFTYPNPENLTPKQAEILKRAAHTCPVALSLHPDIVQETTFNF
ncbi:MAG: OsmC family protein [Cytophaga sp.]|uniref:OsmC family protein n=1 Tax=Cytophaga sp. TaxID=29535 RepID=UPI003F821616